ncbi:hypothetical protein ACFW0I_33350 [[Kitasatospora] papulosa]|uniref:hypothetical protein n=1 Tax=[Kitasatospora] papulosa TaxID=1464011 RepID=UPI0036A97B38
MSQQVTTAKNAEKKTVKPTAHFAGMHMQITEALNIAEFGCRLWLSRLRSAVC